MSTEDLASLTATSHSQLDYSTFRSFMISRSSNRTDLGGRRNFVAVSLKEAESLRRLIHTYHPLFAVQADESQQVSIGLRLLNGALLDASPAFKPVDAGQQTLALQSMRFVNCEMFYNDLQLSLLLKSLQHNVPLRRQAFFENLLRCRRRDRRIFKDTPLNSIFLLADEHSLLSYRAKVARVRFCLHGLNLSLQDAFVKFDALGDTSLNTTELAFALIEYLKLPLSMEDVAQLMTFANKKGDGLMDYEEFAELLREPEIHSQTGKHNDGMNDLQTVKDPSRMDVDGEEDALPSLPVPLMQRQVSATRLQLSPEYQRLYHEEESLRARKQAEAESAVEMARMDKLAREIEKKELEEAQARDWKEIQEMRKLAAMEERWTCVACTFKNEPTAAFCTVCESKRPDQAASERKQDIQDMEDVGEGSDGPTFWACASCSYNNDQANTQCEVCNAPKPKAQRQQKKIVSLWSCPVCTRLVTSDKAQCDVCTSDKEAIRTVATKPEPAVGKGFAALFGDSLMTQDGVPMHVSELTGKTVGLYFSGSWCGPCRAFTPQLSSIYAGARSASLPFEIVFVSADRSIEEFNEYYRTMPWKAVKYSDVELRKRLNSMFGVQGIPCLIVLDQHGNVLTATGREDIATVGDAAIPNWVAQGSAPAAASGAVAGSSNATPVSK
jgi:thiol-disulfide isomerase/thioredoxin